MINNFRGTLLIIWINYMNIQKLEKYLLINSIYFVLLVKLTINLLLLLIKILKMENRSLKKYMKYFRIVKEKIHYLLYFYKILVRKKI